MKFPGFLICLLLAAQGSVNQILAQSVNSPASYGSQSLQGNFEPDPFSIFVSAGGSINADTVASGCNGFIAEAPDFKLVYSDSVGYTLGIFVLGSADATLVVNDPSGNWVCNDDFSDTSNRGAGLMFADPESGTYDIWVGSYSETDVGTQVELRISELGSPWESESDSDTQPPVTAGTGGEPTLYASGTGFLVSRNGHVLTNNHVVEGCRRLTFQIRGDVAVEAVPLATNATTDLALLKTSLTSAPAVFRGPVSLRLGDELVVFGFPLLGDLSSQGNLTNGIVSALSGLNDDLSRLQMTAPIQPGNSGGPVINRAGHIVGVVVETANDEYFRQQRGTVVQNLNFAIHDSLARAFLDTNNVQYESASDASQILPIADIGEQARRYTGQILCYQ